MLICGVCSHVNRLMTLPKLYSVMILQKLESLFLFRQLLIQLGPTAFAGVTSVTQVRGVWGGIADCNVRLGRRVG